MEYAGCQQFHHRWHLPQCFPAGHRQATKPACQADFWQASQPVCCQLLQLTPRLPGCTGCLPVSDAARCFPQQKALFAITGSLPSFTYFLSNASQLVLLLLLLLFSNPARKIQLFPRAKSGKICFRPLKTPGDRVLKVLQSSRAWHLAKDKSSCRDALSLLLTSKKLCTAGQSYKLLKICTPRSCSCKTSGTTLLDPPAMPSLSTIPSWLLWVTQLPLPILTTKYWSSQVGASQNVGQCRDRQSGVIIISDVVISQLTQALV